MKKKDTISEIKTRTVKSLSVLIVREFVLNGAAFIGQLFLFRILSPQDFGIFTIIAFIVNFFDMFTDLGLGFAIIQKKNEPTPAELSTVFFLRQFATIIIVVLLYLLAPYSSFFYKSFSVSQIWMLRIFALTLLFRPLRTLYVALFERDFRYDVIATIEIVGVASYQIFALIFALLGLSVWSLIYAVAIKEVLEVTSLILYRRWLPSFNIKFSDIRGMVRFGFFMQLQGITAFLHDSINPVIVGLLINPYQVGLINFSNNAVGVAKQVTDNYSRVAFTSFAKFQDDREELKQLLMKSTIYLSMFAFYFTVIIFSLGYDIIHFVFSDKWLPGLPFLYFFTLANLLGSIYAPIVSSLLSTGKSKLVLHVTTVMILLEWVIGYILVLILGSIGVAIATFVIIFISFVIYLLLLQFKSLYKNYFRILLPKFLFSAGIIGFAQILNMALPFSFLLFIVKSIIVTVLFIGALYLFSQKEFKQAFQLIKQHYLTRKI